MQNLSRASTRLHRSHERLMLREFFVFALMVVTACAIQDRTSCSVSATNPMMVCKHSADGLLHCLPFCGVVLLERPATPPPRCTSHTSTAPCRPRDLRGLISPPRLLMCRTPQGVRDVKGCVPSKFVRRRAFREIELSAWQVSTRHRPSTPRTSHQPYPSPKPTGRQRNITTGHAARWCGWICKKTEAAALDHAAERPPSADPSAFGGLLCFCPSGHSYGAHMGTPKVAQQVCRRPYASHSALF